MKKFWNLMLAALVIFGAVACTENQEENVQQEAGVSFYAKFADDTRAVIEKDGDVWNTKWENGDVLTVTCGANSFDFIYDGEKFSCNASGVNSILNNEVTISGEYGDSTSGNEALSIEPVDVQFTADMTVTLKSNISFFRFVYTGASEVTLTLDQAAFKKDATTSNTITLSGNANEQLVAIYPTAESAKLTFSLDGVKCKEANLTLVSGKVYNLGERTEKVVLLKSKDNIWDGAWFSAHFWNTSSSEDVTLSKVSDGLYGCVVPAGMTHVIFCRMNTAYTEFKWNSGDSSNNRPVWNRTYEFGVEDAPYNCHFVTKWGNGFADDSAEICPSVWGGKTIVSSDINAWGVIGTMTDDWKQDMKYPMVKGSDGNLIARRLVLKKDAEFKVSNGSSWQPSSNYKITADGVYNVTCTTTGGNFKVTKL